MARQLDPDFRIRAVRPSYSPSNRTNTKSHHNRQPKTRVQPERFASAKAMQSYPRMRHATSSNISSPDARKPLAWIRLVSASLLLIAGSLIIFKLFQGKPIAEADAQSVNTSQVAAAKTTIPNIDEASLSAGITNILASYKGVDSAVSIIDLRSGKIYDYGDQAPYYAASVSKLLSASDFLKHVEKGDYSLSTKVAGQGAGSQLEKLIVNSDNTAWKGFIDLLGHADLEQFAKTNNVNFNADLNTLSAHDTSIFIQRLYQNKILNQEHTKLLLSYMNRASTDQYLEANAPDGASVFQKAGWLDDRLHVAGVVTNGSNGYAVAIYSKVNGSYDFAVGSQFIEQIQTQLNKIFF